MRQRARLEAGSHLRRAGELVKRSRTTSAAGLLSSWSSHKTKRAKRAKPADRDSKECFLGKAETRRLTR